jgi:hypothetical protein
MKAAAILPLLLLGACATTREPEVRIVEVRVPVAISCVPRALGPAPAYPDTDEAVRASPGPGDLLQLLAAGRLLRIQRSAEVEPVIESCRPPDPG